MTFHLNSKVDILRFILEIRKLGFRDVRYFVKGHRVSEVA